MKGEGFGIVGRLKEYLKLIRPYGILFLGFTPVFAAFANGLVDLFSLLLLLVVGMCVHVFTFVQNDVVDVAVDLRSTYVDARPLTSGTLTRNNALAVFGFALFFSMMLAVVFFFSVFSLLVLLACFLCMTLYNMYSKKLPGMEYVLGLGVFFCGLFGAYAASDVLSPLALIICSIGGLQWVFSVGISANLKDVEHDTRQGIRTTPVRLGVTVRNNHLKKPFVFLCYTYLILVVHLFVAFLPFLLLYTSMVVYGLPFPLFLYGVLVILLLLTTQRILSASLIRRDTMLRYEGIHEGFALLLIPTVLLEPLLSHFGVLPTMFLFILLIVVPLFSLRFLFGKTMIPLE